jgi:hypothetical protein
MFDADDSFYSITIEWPEFLCFTDRANFQGRQHFIVLWFDEYILEFLFL